MCACTKYAYMYVRFHIFVWSCIEVGQRNSLKRSGAIQVGGQKTAAGLSGCLGRRLLGMPCALILVVRTIVSYLVLSISTQGANNTHT